MKRNVKKPNAYLYDQNELGNLLIRLLVGCVFLLEGSLKFLNPQLYGVGRFAKIGLEHPEFFSHLVGGSEIICAILIIIGLLTRFAAAYLLLIISSAIFLTKVPLLISKGFWLAAHEGRTDFCMVMGLLFLVFYGAGEFSLDRSLFPSSPKK